LIFLIFITACGYFLDWSEDEQSAVYLDFYHGDKLVLSIFGNSWGLPSDGM